MGEKDGETNEMQRMLAFWTDAMSCLAFAFACSPVTILPSVLHFAINSTRSCSIQNRQSLITSMERDHLDGLFVKLELKTK